MADAWKPKPVYTSSCVKPEDNIAIMAPKPKREEDHKGKGHTEGGTVERATQQHTGGIHACAALNKFAPFCLGRVQI